MFYKVAFNIVKGLVYLLNGKPDYKYLDKLPKGNYILAGPHKTWWDPLLFAMAGFPKEYAFMAKKELFKNKLFAAVLKKVNVFPVDRQNPGPSAIKVPVNYLKKTDLSLVMFPSGTRYSEEMKGGIALIAKMAKVPIVPAVYDGPLTFKDVLKRKKMTVKIGNPIELQDVKKVTPEVTEKLEEQMNAEFNRLYNEDA